jgi:hypothetical protein
MVDNANEANVSLRSLRYVLKPGESGWSGQLFQSWESTPVAVTLTPAPKNLSDEPLSVGASRTPANAGHLLNRLRIFALPEFDANQLLVMRELKSEPSVVLTIIEKLIAEKKARVVTNPVITTKSGSGFRIRLEGVIVWEIDATLEPENETVHVMMFVDNHEGGKLSCDTTVKVGASEFIGTLELPAALRGTDGPEICLAFFSVN